MTRVLFGRLVIFGCCLLNCAPPRRRSNWPKPFVCHRKTWPNDGAPQLAVKNFWIQQRFFKKERRVTPNKFAEALAVRNLSFAPPEINQRREFRGPRMELQAMLVAFFASVVAVNSLKPGDCEVCIKTLDKFRGTLSEDVTKDPKKIETEFKKFCKGLKNKENRFCYYLGGLEESATGILGEMSKPLSWSMPSDKICEKLKKKDVQICELRYDVEIDLKTVDLKKLKVRDLKKILNDWGEECEGCIEKGEYLKRIEELKPKHTEL